MGTMLAMLAMLVIAAGCGMAALKPQVVKTIFPTDDVVIASVIVNSTRDASADATKDIQLAIDTAANAGGGVVFLPAGRYLIDHLVIKEGVTLRGDWTRPVADDTADRGKLAQGTILIPNQGVGHADGTPTIYIERGAGLREMTIWYPNQNAQHIEPYPWTIATSPRVSGDNTTIYNVTLVNPYQAIRVGPEWNELHYIRNVYGTPLKTGLSIDTCTDIGRVVNVDFGPQWWETSGFPGAPETKVQKAALHDFMMREGVGYDIGRSDWEYLDQIRATGYGVGCQFRQGKQGATNAVMYESHFLDCGTPLLLDRLNGIGLAATRCEFTGQNHAVYAPASFNAVAQFNTCTFKGRFPVTLEGPGTLTMQNCSFPAYPEAAVEAKRGTVTVLGCDFGPAAADVKLDEGARRARVLGNKTSGPLKVVNSSHGDVEVADGPMQFAAIPQLEEKDAPMPRPPTDAVYDVTAFGADPKSDNNSHAFAQALEAAANAGGGTVYVPAGYYRLRDPIEVPTGVELRGCFDVPHHTVSGGSVLLCLSGRGQEKGTPFVSLDHNSGLRGLTVWYPEQNMLDPVPYPWTVQSKGPGCWMVDVTLGNSWQGADFWTYPSTGHIIRYLGGCYLRRGLYVSKCDGEGWVEDTQFNPHYAFRIPPSMPHPKYKTSGWQPAVNFIATHLEGLVFGRCQREYITRTFLYDAREGLVFRDDGGGTNARVIEHGTDAGGSSLVLEKAGPEGLQFINTQLVHLGPAQKAAIVVADSFAGQAQFFNSQMWAGLRTGIIGGTGDVLLQQFNSLTGPLTVNGGRLTMENAHFTRDLRPAVTVGPKCEAVKLVADVAGPGDFHIDNQAGDHLYARANGAPLRPTGTHFTLKTGWEAGQPEGKPNVVARNGGLKAVSDGQCGPVDSPDAHSGKRMLRIAGKIDDPKYAYAYYKILGRRIDVASDSTLTYWLRPVNENGRHCGVDLTFTDGGTLRDVGLKDESGTPTHPETPRGVVGKWTKIVVPLGQLAGRTTATVMFAFDERNCAPGGFEAWMDDLSIEAPSAAGPWKIAMTPASGTCAVGSKVTLRGPQGVKVHYTLDGISPDAKSPVYTAPIVLSKPGLWEVRCAAEMPDGTVSGRVFVGLYDVKQE